MAGRCVTAAGKPTRPHWRRHGEPQTTGGARSPGRRSAQRYAVSVRAHSESVLRSFYDFHRDLGTGPILNPFPLDRSRRGRRAHAHRNPMDPPRHERTGLYRPTVPARVLVAFYVSTGARASELLSATQGGVDPGRQLITVVRKAACSLVVPLHVMCGRNEPEVHGLGPQPAGQLYSMAAVSLMVMAHW